MNLLQSIIMHKKVHSRGFSQEFTTASTREKDPLHNFKPRAISSEHTRSTAPTTKSKEKATKPKHRKRPSKLCQPVWDPENLPYSADEVLKFFPHLLSPFEAAEIKEYKSIYYVGERARESPSLRTLPEQHFYQYKIGGHIAYRYQIIESINKGSFGEVLKVYDHKTHEHLALKVVKKVPELIKQTFVEISILTNIKEKDKDDLSGIVRIKDFTIFRDHICIIMELLDANLYELMSANSFKGLPESFIRIFAIQILNSLNFLDRMGVVHCDIKPENVVLKAWGKSGIKLIDFGTSCYQQQQNYTYIQSRYYRAPEVIFQRYYSTSIDMWSFGLMMAELSIGTPLFPGRTDLQQLLYMIALMGYPEPEFSHSCRLEIDKIRESKYLVMGQDGKISEESRARFQRETGSFLSEDCFGSLEQRIPKDQMMFVHFLKQIIRWNPKDRITPSEALQHPWILAGLPEEIKQLYTLYQSIDTLNNKEYKRKDKKRKQPSREKLKIGAKKSQLGEYPTKTLNKGDKHSQQKSCMKSKSQPKKSKEKSKSLKKTGAKSPKKGAKM